MPDQETPWPGWDNPSQANHPGLRTRSLICQTTNHIGVASRRRRRLLQLKVGQKKPQQSHREQGSGGGSTVALLACCHTHTKAPHDACGRWGKGVWALSASFISKLARSHFVYIFFWNSKPVPKQKPRNQTEEAEAEEQEEEEFKSNLTINLFKQKKRNNWIKQG